MMFDFLLFVPPRSFHPTNTVSFIRFVSSWVERPFQVFRSTQAESACSSKKSKIEVFLRGQMRNHLSLEGS
jgi:hypothetical protein